MSSAYHSANSSPELGGERLSYHLTPVDETREWHNIGAGGQRPDTKAYRIRKIMAGTIRLLFPILKYYDEAALPIIDNDLRRRNLEYVNSSLATEHYGTYRHNLAYEGSGRSTSSLGTSQRRRILAGDDGTDSIAESTSKWGTPLPPALEELGWEGVNSGAPAGQEVNRRVTDEPRSVVSGRRDNESRAATEIWFETYCRGWELKTVFCLR